MNEFRFESIHFAKKSAFDSRVLGFTVTNGLSVSSHVHSVIASKHFKPCVFSAPMGYAIVHNKPYTDYRAVVVAKLAYASSAWIGFSSANDRQKITAFIRRSKRTGFCSCQLDDTIHVRYDTIGEFNVDSKAEYTA